MKLLKLACIALILQTSKKEVYASRIYTSGSYAYVSWIPQKKKNQEDNSQLDPCTELLQGRLHIPTSG